MSAGEVYKHLSDHVGFPNSQHKGAYLTSSGSHLPPHSQDSHVASSHANAHGIHFGHNYNQHAQSHSATLSKSTSQNVRGSNHSNGPQLFPHESHINQQSRKQDSYLDNRTVTPSYIESSRIIDSRTEREAMPEMKSSLDDEGGGNPLKRSLRVEEMRDLYQSQANELKHVREQYQRLTDDNQELRDLCCFLDDDRQKGRKLAREWQRFGRYTASVMRQEVSAYQNKLRELDAKQQELIKDNLELKELCLYLDEERSNASCANCGHPLSARDDGDGSSSSTNADESLPTQLNIQPTTHTILHTSNRNADIPLSRSSSREFLLQDNLNSQRSAFNGQVLSYIRSLEARILLLETEKQQLAEEIMKSRRSLPEGEGSDSVQRENGFRPPHPPPYSLAHQMRAMGLGINANGHLNSGDCDDEPLGLPPPPPVTRPAAVAAAMRVLEVQEQLESLPPPPPPNLIPSEGPFHQPPIISQTNSSSNYQNQQYRQMQQQDLADGEKAILRQMCNVVWRKLEEVPSQNR